VGISGLLIIGMAILFAADLALAEKPQVVSPSENDTDDSDVMNEIKRRAEPKPEKTGLSQPMPSSIDGRIWNGADM
jgi:hypothetical protein